MFGLRVFFSLLFIGCALGDVICSVRDASNNQPVAGALCTLRSRTESLLYGSATTDSSGLATIVYTLVSQEYLLRVTDSRYYVADDVFTAVAGSTDTRNVAISPLLNTTGIRAVLRWGATPSDIDSHVFINASTWDCDEVYYSQKTCNGQGVPQPKISLDVDDTSSYGPETVTFSALTPGRYAYWIYIYSSGYAFSSSQATVELYTGANGAGVFQFFSVPNDTSTSNRWWHVFDVIVSSDGSCTDVRIETFNAVTNSESVQSAVQTSANIGRTCSVSSSVCNTRVTGAWKTCGNFGDPHIITWDRVGVTCRAVGTSLLIDNEWFSLGMTNVQVNDGTGATATTSITLIYKQCNALSLTVTPYNFPEPANAIDAGIHKIRKVGNNLYMDAINTRIQIREVGDYLVFGISTPWWNGTGICNGCPGDELNTTDVDGLVTKKRAATAYDVPSARAACSAQGLAGFFYDACVFDLMTTGNDTFIQQAATANVTYTEVQQPFLLAPAPKASPPPSQQISAPTPVAGATINVVAAILVIFAAIFSVLM